MIKFIKRLIPKGEFSRNVLTLMTGTTIAQAIPIAVSPILTRLYSPDDFGILALFISVTSVLIVIATGRYELAIMLPDNENDAANIFSLSVLIALFISLITFIIVFFLNSQITLLLGNPEISNWLYLVPFTVLFMGIYQSLNYWNNRRRQYKKLAVNKIVQTGTTATANLGLGINGFSAGGLIIGNLTGQFISVFNLGMSSIRKKEIPFRNVNKDKMIYLAKVYKKLPLFNLPNALIDGLRMSGINILITRFFTSAILGQFYLSFRMLQAPMSLIGYSISQVFIQKISTIPKNKHYEILKRFLIAASFLSFPLFVIIFFFAKDIFVFVFGTQWQIAGEAASIMAPWIFFNFLSSPVSNIFIVLNRQEVMLVYSIFYMAIPLAIIYFYNSSGFLFTLTLISISMSIMLVAFILIAIYYVKIENK